MNLDGKENTITANPGIDGRRCRPGDEAKSPFNETTDSITRELDEIRERSRGTMRFSNSQAKKLGSAYVLLSIAESSGLREDLLRSFGKYGDWMLAEAVSMIRMQEDEKGLPDLESNMTRELLGIADSMGQSLTIGFIRRIGSDESTIEELFRRRIGRSNGVLVADTPYIGEFGDVDAEDDEPGYWVSCDENGIPVHYKSGTMRELREYGFDRYQNEIRELGARARTFILEKRTGNADLYERLIERGSRFISIPKSGTPCTLDVSNRIRTMGSVHKLDGVAYSVYSTPVAIVSRRIRKSPENPDENDCTDTLDIVTESDPRFRESPPHNRFTMWAYSRVESSTIDPAKMERKISVIERRLRSLPPQDAMDQFHETAGSLSRFFRISVENGELNLTVRQRELDMYLEQKPSVFFSHGFDSWERMINAFDLRQNFDTAMSALQGQLRVRMPLEDRELDLGRTYIRFVALILWCLTAHRLDTAGIEEDVGTVLDWLDSVRALGDGITWRVVGLTPRNRTLMASMGAKHPRNTMVTLPYEYDPDE